jgi:predicted nucleotidyltransferase component of viral defense system
MENNKIMIPKSQKELDRAIQKIDSGEQTKRAVAQTVVGQMLPEGVAKGGSALKFRFGNNYTRFTRDLDTARKEGVQEYIDALEEALQNGWNGFTGRVVTVQPASPIGVDSEYVMQPFEIKLQYLGKPWTTVELEVGHNEIGDAETPDYYISSDTVALFEAIGLPIPAPIALISLPHQIAQKLHAVSTDNSNRAHDLIDLQLIEKYETIDYSETRKVCVELFKYRQMHTWAPLIVKGDNWDEFYAAQLRDIDVLPTADEAISWVNDFVSRIDAVEG